MKESPDLYAWSQVERMRHSTSPFVSSGPRRIVLLGPTGAGKGTQARLLSSALGAYHLGIDDIFRGASTDDSEENGPAMHAALDFTRRGESVPDHLMLQVLKERRDGLTGADGFLLDGFPQTVRQAEAIDQLLHEHGLALDAAISYEISPEEIIRRLTGRRTCPACDAFFHLTIRPPRTAGICDQCGTRLVQHDADCLQAIRTRLVTYNTRAAPLHGYYRTRGLLLTVPAVGSPPEVFASTLAAFRHAATSRPPMSTHPFGSQAQMALYGD